MSYVGDPFRHDIFVSYSHGEPDDQGGLPLAIWSQAFTAELEAGLRANEALSEGLSVYIDKRVDRLEGLTEQLQADVGAAAILAVLMTPGYLRSSWCADEREWWLKAQADEPVRLSPDGRVALVRVQPIRGGESAWPDLLADGRRVPLPGFAFFKDAPGQPAQRFPCLPESAEGGEPFRAALATLVGDLGVKLRKLRASMAERQRIKMEAVRLAGNQHVVYLHGRVEDELAWGHAHESLTDSGFVVVPSEPETVARDLEKGQELRKERVRVLSECDALLLVGSSNGIAVDADMMVVGRSDRQSARALTNRLLPCAVVDTVGPQVATRRRLITAKSLQVDWIDCTRPPWTPGMRDWLQRKSLLLTGDG